LAPAIPRFTMLGAVGRDPDHCRSMGRLSWAAVGFSDLRLLAPPIAGAIPLGISANPRSGFP
jgi:hypothetical protein